MTKNNDLLIFVEKSYINGVYTFSKVKEIDIKDFTEQEIFLIIEDKLSKLFKKEDEDLNISVDIYKGYKSHSLTSEDKIK